MCGEFGIGVTEQGDFMKKLQSNLVIYSIPSHSFHLKQILEESLPDFSDMITP